ncbi:MAG: HAMP domain-containing sensor histidine kinase [Kineosporiaceae bacterium]
MTRSAGLAARLLTAQVVVVATAIVAAWLVAAVVGPPIFHDHLTRMAHGGSAGDVLVHAEQAYRQANGVAVAVAVLAALAVAGLASAYVARRVTGPVAALARASEEVAEGRYRVDVPRPGLGPEFDQLAAAFAAMAQRLDGVEATRRRLLGDLAHEVRTPVATLDAYLEGLEDGVVTLDAATLAMLRDQTRRLTRLAEDVAAVSRAEEHRLDLQPAPTDPADLVRAALAASADRYAEAGVRLTGGLVLADGDPGLLVRVDADRIGQVLANLLDNALRHTPAGGRVNVRAFPDAVAGTVVIEVADDGDGIPVEHLPHVFERFYRVDRARDRAHGGSGIGLAVVASVVEAHGGRVTAESPGEGGGSTFTITLPAAG